MTYYEMVTKLINTSPKCYNQDATVQIGNEFYPIESLIITDKSCDILDPGHLVIKVKE